MASEGTGWDSSPIPTYHAPPVPTSLASRVDGTPANAPTIPGHEILGELGRGGMGVVYRARQVAMGRIVALKTISAGAAAFPDQRSRFRREAEAAAHLDHPGIVPIHEVGEHEGCLYFSMGLVSGTSLSDQVAEQPLESRRAADLMRQVALAIAYAHERGIVHRDIKPSNILLDELGRPRVGDFGLARRLDMSSELTATGQVLGTPAYMPPEQAGGSSEQVGPAADIYALGATLYRLLTGRPPFQAANPLDTLKQMLESEPVPPRQLNPSIARDLETIVLKCLEKDPAQRYPSASELADDLRRWLEGRSIVARPLGPLARGGRWIRRNPTLALASGLALGSFLVGLVGVTWQWRRAEALLVETRTQRQKAEANLRRAQDAVDQLLSSVADELKNVPRMGPLRRELLEKALALTNEFLDEVGDDPSVRLDAGRARLRMGRILQSLGRLDEADTLLNSATALLDTVPATSERVAEVVDARANIWFERGLVQTASRRFDAAEASLKRAVDIDQAWLSTHPESPLTRFRLAKALKHLGIVLESTRRFDDAEAAYNQALIQLEAIPEGFDSSRRYVLADVRNSLGVLQRLTGRPDEARLQYIRALEALESPEDSAPLDRDPLDLKASVHYNLGNLESAASRLDEADRAYGEATVLREQLCRDYPDVAKYQEFLARVHFARGYLWKARQDLPVALTEYRRCLTVYEKLRQAFPDQPVYAVGLAGACNNLSNLLATMGQTDEAIELLERSVAIYEPLVEAEPEEADYRSGLGLALSNLALRTATAVDRESAIPLHRRAFDELRATLGLNPRHPDFSRQLRIEAENGARTLLQSSDPGAAAAIADNLVAALPEDAQARLSAARILTLRAKSAFESDMINPTVAREYVETAVGHFRAGLDRGLDPQELARDIAIQELRRLDGSQDFLAELESTSSLAGP